MTEVSKEDRELLDQAAKLDIGDRCAHSHWKVRAEAYAHITETCNKRSRGDADVDAFGEWWSATAAGFPALSHPQARR